MPTQQFSPSRLRTLRERSGVTRTAVAYAVGRSEQSVWLWERGKTTPSVDTLARIADFLSCSVADFYEDASA